MQFSAIMYSSFRQKEDHLDKRKTSFFFKISKKKVSCLFRVSNLALASAYSTRNQMDPK